MATAIVETKPAVQSTQNWGNVAIALLTAIFGRISPAFGDFISNHPDLVVGVVALINILWRTFVTKTKIEGIVTTPK